MTTIRSRKVLNSARGQTCTARFPGICNGDPETTVWAHLNGAAFGKGMGIKAHDVLGFHSCSECHRYLDTGHGTKPILSDAELLRCLIGAVTETWVRLINAGIVIVPIDAPTPNHAKPTPPRKPPEQRAKIAARADPWPKGRKLPTRPMKRKEDA